MGVEMTWAIKCVISVEDYVGLEGNKTSTYLTSEIGSQVSLLLT